VALSTNEKTQRLLWLDLLRGLAAFAVAAEHLRAGLVVDYVSIDGPTGNFVRFFYFITSLGHQSVVIFFVLSGFFVGGSVLARGDTFSWFSYVRARLCRLWIVLIPALLLTLIADLILQASGSGVTQGSFQQLWHTGPNPDGSWSIGPTRFISNLLFLQTIETPVYGSNMPLWSLANEFWYYVLFPLAFLTLSKHRAVITRVSCGLLIMLLVIWLPATLLQLMIVWLLGVGAWWVGYRIPASRFDRWLLAWGLILSIGSLVIVRLPSLHVPHGLQRDLLVGFSFALLIMSLSRQKMPSALRTTLGRFAEWSANISYSLYLCHMPVTLLLLYFLVGRDQVVPSLIGYSAFLASFLMVVLITWVFWALFERHTETIKHRLSKRAILAKTPPTASIRPS
jgi:peptidoglycan/LPS O-acetylase OafA/YrhL